MTITIYIEEDGNVTIRFPASSVPDKDTLRRIMEVLREEKKSLAGEQTNEGQSLN